MENFTDTLGRLSAPIKSVLLDQNKLVCGVGNWIADECLFQACLSPSTPSNSLSEAQVAALRDALLAVCRMACDCNADSDRFPSTWLFHHRWAGMTTGSINSPIGRIHFDTVGGRTTAFLPSKQLKGELSAASIS